MENSKDSSEQEITIVPVDGLPIGFIYTVDFTKYSMGIDPCFEESFEFLYEKKREGISGRDEGEKKPLADPAPEIEPD